MRAAARAALTGALLSLTGLYACRLPRLGPAPLTLPPAGSGTASGKLVLSAPELLLASDYDEALAAAQRGTLQVSYSLAAFLEDYDLPAATVPIGDGGLVKTADNTWEQNFSLANLRQGSYVLALSSHYSNGSGTGYYSRLAELTPLELEPEGASRSGLTVDLDLGGAAAGARLTGAMHLSGSIKAGEELFWGIERTDLSRPYTPGPQATYRFTAPDAAYGRIPFSFDGVGAGDYYATLIYGGASAQDAVMLQDGQRTDNIHLGQGVSSSKLDIYELYPSVAGTLDPTATDYPFEFARLHGAINCQVDVQGNPQWQGDVILLAESIGSTDSARAWSYLQPSLLQSGGSAELLLEYLPTGDYQLRVMRLGALNSDPLTELARAAGTVSIGPPVPQDGFYVPAEVASTALDLSLPAD